MKKLRLITTIVSILTILSMSLSLASCSSKKQAMKKKNKDTKKEVIDDDDDEKEGKEDKDKDGNKKPHTAVNGLVSPNPPDNYKPLTEELLFDTWVDENGVYFRYTEDGYLTDYLGNEYIIQEVLDDGVILSIEDNYWIEYDLYDTTPLLWSFFFPMYLTDDELIVGENHLVRASSNEGEKYINDLMEGILEKDFFIDIFPPEFDEYYSAFINITFYPDGTLDAYNDYENDELEWSIKDGLITLEDPMYGEVMATSLYKMDDKRFAWNMGDSETCVLYDQSVEDYQTLDGDYIYFEAFNDNVYQAYIENGQATVTSLDSDQSYKDFNLEYDDGYPIIRVGFDEFDIDGSLLGLAFENYYDSYDSSMFIVFRNSIQGQLMLYREDVINGRIDNRFMLSTFTYEADNITVEYKTNDDSSVFWNCNTEIPTLTEYNYYDSNHSYKVIGPVVGLYDLTPAVIAYKIPKTAIDSIDSIGITYGDFFYDLGEDLLDESMYTIEENKNEYVITLESIDSYAYGLVDTSFVNQMAQQRTWDIVVSTDPYDSVWANTCYTGSILELVDLDYISNSIIDENGSADFWVSTPEELASATYYINELDVPEYDVSTMFYIHLMNDINLTDYSWAPIGQCETDYHCPNKHYNHMMQGIIFGNGYTIKNMHISDCYNAGFVGYCHLTTIIGLTLEDFMNESYDYYRCALIGEGSCITEIFDCTVILNNYYENITEFSASANDSIEYYDCEFFVSKDGSTLENMPLGNEYNQGEYNGYDNWVRRYYQNSNGEYKYNSAAEYKDYLKNPEPFNNGTYYFDDGSDKPEEHIGYLDFVGYLYNDEFMVNYGCIRDKYN